MEMRFIKDKNRLLEAIQSAFSGDEDLINCFHIVSTGELRDCVEDTYYRIVQASEEYLLDWFEIRKNGKVIGFTILSRPYSFLYSFGLNKEYRKREISEYWWQFVRGVLGNKFSCVLWAKNSRAINFLVKNGMKIFAQKEKETHLMYN